MPPSTPVHAFIHLMIILQLLPSHPGPFLPRKPPFYLATLRSSPPPPLRLLFGPAGHLPLEVEEFDAEVVEGAELLAPAANLQSPPAMESIPPGRWQCIELLHPVE